MWIRTCWLWFMRVFFSHYFFVPRKADPKHFRRLNAYEGQEDTTCNIVPRVMYKHIENVFVHEDMLLNPWVGLKCSVSKAICCTLYQITTTFRRHLAIREHSGKQRISIKKEPSQRTYSTWLFCKLTFNQCVERLMFPNFCFQNLF